MSAFPLRFNLATLINAEGINFEPIKEALEAAKEKGDWPSGFPHIFTVMSRVRASLTLHETMINDRCKWYKENPQWAHEQCTNDQFDVVVGLPEHHPMLEFLNSGLRGARVHEFMALCQAEIVLDTLNPS